VCVCMFVNLCLGGRPSACAVLGKDAATVLLALPVCVCVCVLVCGGVHVRVVLHTSAKPTIYAALHLRGNAAQSLDNLASARVNPLCLACRSSVMFLARRTPAAIFQTLQTVEIQSPTRRRSFQKA